MENTMNDASPRTDEHDGSKMAYTATPTPDERDKIWTRVKKIRFCVLSNVDVGGAITSRPLTTQEVDDSGRLVYFVHVESALAESLDNDNRVNVSYTDSGDNFYVSFVGTASIRRDPDKAEKLWGTMNEAWFPGGPKDPDLLVLEVDVDRVEYWDSGKSRVVQMLTMAKAAVTKTPPSDMGEHGSFRP